MSESYQSRSKFNRESIIGLGEESFRKNYYPELQEKLLDLEEVNARLKALIKAMPDIILSSNKAGRVIPVNELQDISFLLINTCFKDNDFMTDLRGKVEETFYKSKITSYEYALTSSEEVFYLDIRIIINDIEEAVIMIRDISSRVELENELRYRADRDLATKLFNRQYFLDELQRIEQAPNKALGIALFDIDGLKFFNDTLGHNVGDEVINKVADFISTIFGDYSLIARVGGDEFGVIFEDTYGYEFEEDIKALYKVLEIYNEKTETTHLSISLGYSIWTLDESVLNIIELYHDADHHLQQNKLLKNSSHKNNMVKTLMKALEARDFITEGHVDRMEILAYDIAKLFLLDHRQLDRIKLLAKFHDIGKVGIPDKILNKPGRLDEEEYDVMKQHSTIGQKIADASDELRDIADLILKHHEKWDGSGYPLGLKGKEIPIECRIISVCDAYDAMVNDRPYCLAMSSEEASKELLRCVGTQFDPVIVTVFMTHIKQLEQ